MTDPDFDCAVIGAGAVGLATAAALARSGQSVLVIEGGEHAGEETTARNSEVIHAGLYYPTGSLKHRLCVEGRRMLYEFMDATGVPYRKCGKLIVASRPEEEEKLAAIAAMGEANGVEGLSMISADEAHGMEPEITVAAALLSRETGIFDSHDYLMRLIAALEEHDGLLALRTPFEGAERDGDGFAIRTGGDDPATITASRIVNAGGLWAADIAGRIDAMPADAIPHMRYAKGCYFRLSGRPPFSRLIYPVPEDGGLGVHATLDLGGQVRFGPDVEWLEDGTGPGDIDYRVDPGRGAAFTRAIRSYWPGLEDGRLEPDYSGVRPKLKGPGEGFFDFDIQTEERHGIPGLVNLFGIESPGLTSSLAIGKAVAETLT